MLPKHAHSVFGKEPQRFNAVPCVPPGVLREDRQDRIPQRLLCPAAR